MLFMIMKKGVLEEAYKRAVYVLKVCSTKNGLYASGGKKGYRGVWARDSMISMLGGSFLSEFKEVFNKSIGTLRENQSKNGQIPNCVDKWSEKKPHVDYQSIDSSLWFIIGNYIFKHRYKDKSLFDASENSIKRALNWLSCQDSGENGMLTQLPTSDWQDAFPHRYGYTINTQALYYYVLNLIGERIKAKRLRLMVDKDDDKKLWNGSYYYSYRWKNHNKYKEIGDWFDSLGNLLAIIFGLADKSKSEKILKYINDKKINQPYPVKSIFPPIKKGSKYWQDYYLDCDAGKPNHYLNAGIWLYIGSFYVLALIKLKKFKDAEKELKKIALINLKGNFPEWVNPINKKMHWKLQAWSAGTYILAYESLKKKRVMI